MSYILAVSGGVDSVVLLDMLSKSMDYRPLVVAHVDHGIRSTSDADARFVDSLARYYKLPFINAKFTLGPNASEDAARKARYEFLEAKAKELNAKIITAHHQDDVIGSIAINLLRGTGWRGLAVMDRAEILRPLLVWTKSHIYEYALKHKLEWVEDETNAKDIYLRNKIRSKIISLDEQKASHLMQLRAQQLQLRRDISRELRRLVSKFGGQRYIYTNIDSKVACEMLRQEVAEVAGISLMRPQAERALVAIKTAKAGSEIVLADGIRISFTTTRFIVSQHP